MEKGTLFDLSDKLKSSKFARFFERKVPQKLIQRLSNDGLPLVLASILVGLLSVLYELMFEWGEKLSIKIYNFNPHIFWILSPLTFFLSFYIIRNYSKFSNGSGIPQLLAAIDLSDSPKKKILNKLLGLKVILVKIASSLILLIGGGSIGREGPTLQISGSIFQLVSRLFSKTKKNDLKTMLITSGASGLAAAFNTPLGGIVYVVEELSKSHINKLRVPVFTAVIFAGFTAQFFMGPYLFLGFPKTQTLPLNLIPLGFGLAILGGIFGSLLSLFVLKIFTLSGKFQNPYVIPVILGLLFAALLINTGQETLGTGKPLINRILFNANHDLPWYTFPGRFLGSLFSFSSGGAGGIFATSLSSGAALGNWIASYFDISAGNHNLLVLMTMIAFLTGVTRTPFTSSILVLEMTDRHSAIFFFLMAGIIAQFASERILRKPFYEILKERILAGFEKSKPQVNS